MKNFVVFSILLIFAYNSQAQTTLGPREMCLKIDYTGPNYVNEHRNYYIKNCCEGSIKITIKFTGGKSGLTKKKKLKSLQTYHVVTSDYVVEIYAEEVPEKKK
jgi:hypothetical protein